MYTVYPLSAISIGSHFKGDKNCNETLYGSYSWEYNQSTVCPGSSDLFYKVTSLLLLGHTVIFKENVQ